MMPVRIGVGLLIVCLAVGSCSRGDEDEGWRVLVAEEEAQALFQIPFLLSLIADEQCSRLHVVEEGTTRQVVCLAIPDGALHSVWPLDPPAELSRPRGDGPFLACSTAVPDGTVYSIWAVSDLGFVDYEHAIVAHEGEGSGRLLNWRPSPPEAGLLADEVALLPGPVFAVLWSRPGEVGTSDWVEVYNDEGDLQSQYRAEERVSLGEKHLGHLHADLSRRGFIVQDWSSHENSGVTIRRIGAGADSVAVMKLPGTDLVGVDSQGRIHTCMRGSVASSQMPSPGEWEGSSSGVVAIAVCDSSGARLDEITLPPLTGEHTRKPAESRDFISVFVALNGDLFACEYHVVPSAAPPFGMRIWWLARGSG